MEKFSRVCCGCAMSGLLFSAGGCGWVSMLEQLALLVPYSSQAAPGTLSGDDASPVPGLAGTFRPQIRLRSFVALKVPHMTHPRRGRKHDCFSRGWEQTVVSRAVGHKGRKNSVRA